MCVLENDLLRVEISKTGAELRSIRSKTEGYEMLWSGDPAIWGGISPLLFPVVGKLRNDAYHFAGKSYHLPMHGFAGKARFALCASDAASLSFQLSSSGETLGLYPFPFVLTIRYSLTGARLGTTLCVENTGDSDMWFSIGAHPGFACETDARLIFEQAEAPWAYRLNREHLLPEGMQPLPIVGNVWQLDAHTFDHDAFILQNPRSGHVIIESPGRPRRVRVSFGSVPYLGIWAKPNAPYVCIEPWFGVDDTAGHDGDITQKRGICRLVRGQRFSYAYTIEIC